MHTRIKIFLTRYRALYYGIIGILCFSCSVNFPPSQVGTSENGTIKSRPIKFEDENSTYIITPRGNEHRTLVFEVFQTNISGDTISAGPDNWQLQYATSNSISATKNMKMLAPMTPMDRSIMYEDLAYEVENNRRAGRSVGIFIGVVLIVGLLVVIMKSSDDNDDEEGEDESVSFSDVNLNVNFNFITQSGETREFQFYDKDPKIPLFLDLSEQVVHDDYGTRTLQPDESHQFYLYFPRSNNMKQLMLQGPESEKGRMSFWFQHKLDRSTY